MLAWASWHLRPHFILQKLCFADHSIPPQAVERSIIEHGMAWGSREANLLGKPHV